ncbi:MAG: type II secretion system F family protein [Blastocatellia bacterium]|nr:type II secretion system F family protein [Blastocatellia bacterium]
MAEFDCRLGTSTGEVVNRTYEAEALAELQTRLEREGYKIFSISKKGGQTLLSKGLKATRRLSIEDFLVFNQQLATMLRAGLPILQALGILTKRQKAGFFRTVLEDVETKVRSGTALSEAFAAQGGVFPRLYTASILAGERSGDLDNVLLRYVNYTKTITELRRKLKKTLIYPAILIIASVGLVILMTTYVIPKFASLYESSSSKLPYLTELVVGVSNAITNNLTIIVPPLFVLLVATALWRQTDQGKMKIDEWMLKLPLVGDLIRQNTTAQLSRSLATLLAGGITLLEAFEIASESVTNRSLRKSMLTVASRIRTGQAFTESLQEAGWLPPLALDMIGVGEKSGSLREMLDEVANFYDAELDVKLTALTSIIEPIILVVMGSVVMVILLSMYLPILELMRKNV